MPIAIRPAALGDLELAAAIVQRSINDLRVKRGFEANEPLRPVRFPAFCLAEDPRGLWVAEQGSTVVGFAFSWVSDEFWYLAQLFLEPEFQVRGIGTELLKRTLAHAEASGARNRALITFAYNLSATGLYLQHGLVPRIPLLRLSGRSGDAVARLGDTDCTCVEFGGGEAPVAALTAIDEAVLGFRRAAHHRFSIDAGDRSCLLIRRGDETAGYAYLAPDGSIGPFALRDPRDGSDAITAVLKRAAALSAERLSMIVPGPAEDILAVASRAGMRVVNSLVLHSSRPFGDWRAYLPRDPAYL